MSRSGNLERPNGVLLVAAIVILGLVPTAWAQSKFKTLYTFAGFGDGSSPTGSVTFDQAGNLYGTTVMGGVGFGTVFELSANSDGTWTHSVLYNFNGGSDGAHPYASLIFDPTGNLYGTTYDGGDQGAGTVFKLTPNTDGSWTETVLHSFCSLKRSCPGGGNPYDRLIFDAAGNLYGTTYGSGTGMVFQLKPNQDGSWTETVLHSFCFFINCHDASGPTAGLIFDQAGNLYGTTLGGVPGTVFQLTPNANGSWKERVLHHFGRTKKDGGVPYAGLIFDQAGNLYGTTEFGGDSGLCSQTGGCGVAFKLTPKSSGGWKETVLREFTDQDGFNPQAGLIFDQTGNLYGTTGHGGDLSLCRGTGCGVIFKLAPKSSGGWKETVLHTFHDDPGAFPIATPIIDAAGNLYGTTEGDGIMTFGSVFEIAP